MGIHKVIKLDTKQHPESAKKKVVSKMKWRRNGISNESTIEM